MPYILLSSAKNDQQGSRSFNEFSSPSQMAQKIIDYFEDWLALKESGPDLLPVDNNLEYTSEDLFIFMDEFFGELVCLEKDEETQLWIPQVTDWIKEQIYFELRRMTHKHAGVMSDQTNFYPTDVVMEQ